MFNCKIFLLLSTDLCDICMNDIWDKYLREHNLKTQITTDIKLSNVSALKYQNQPSNKASIHQARSNTIQSDFKEVLTHRVKLSQVTQLLTHAHFMKKTCLYFHKWKHIHSVCTCYYMSTAVFCADSWVTPHQPASGQSDWAGLAGKFPFVGNRFMWKEDVCFTCIYVCVTLCGRCMTLLDFYGLWSDQARHLAWKTEGDTHTHTHTL